MTKPLLCGLLLLVGRATAAWAQTAPATGVIHYEVSHRLDSPKIIGLDGNEIKPGMPGYPEGIPDVLTQALTLTFGPAAARETLEAPHLALETPNDVPERPTVPRRGGLDSLRPSFSETVYADFKTGRQIQVLTVGGHSPVRLRTEVPYGTPPDWRETGRQKKVAGYRCREAKVTWKGKPCTLWFTTDLPFTYSPECTLTPPRGVVLWLQGAQDEYRATRIEPRTVAEADVLPDPGARPATAAELAEEKEKAEADFMRRLVDGAQK